ncbi:MAG: 16S rRNA (guanine(527)-N(7))-methyltransferase RsmG, partial [Deltaproteobacteria bacterium]
MVNEKKLLKWQALAGDVKIEIEEGTSKDFDVYLRELVKWNRRFNLTGIKDPVEIQIKNFQDSMAVSKLIPRRILSLVDIGSGAGFPGLVLKILLPQLLVYLVEPNAHRYNFLCHIKRVLRLAGLEIYKGSIEKWFSEFENVWRTMSPLYISRAWKKP